MSFTALQRVRLWLSYQRYAFALTALAAAMVGAAIVTRSWIIAAIVAVPVLLLLRFAVVVAARFRNKMRITRIAAIRARQGRFRPESMKPHCGDPCFRVVANECMTLAGIPGQERRQRISQYRIDLREAPATLLLRDPNTGRTILVGGEQPTK